MPPTNFEVQEHNKQLSPSYFSRIMVLVKTGQIYIMAQSKNHYISLDWVSFKDSFIQMKDEKD